MRRAPAGCRRACVGERGARRTGELVGCLVGSRLALWDILRRRVGELNSRRAGRRLVRCVARGLVRGDVLVQSGQGVVDRRHVESAEMDGVVDAFELGAEVVVEAHVADPRGLRVGS